MTCRHCACTSGDPDHFTTCQQCGKQGCGCCLSMRHLPLAGRCPTEHTPAAPAADPGDPDPEPGREHYVVTARRVTITVVEEVWEVDNCMEGSGAAAAVQYLPRTLEPFEGIRKIHTTPISSTVEVIPTIIAIRKF